ncbi:MAG: DNA sulfur modification protein DndE [Krumholzibacteria bacterium]|nr:DNA sulfur modification protein DndE [Candidatus Krumholzibacteria bacterium]
MPIETVRISKSGKDQLATLKRRTKIPTWNVLCRWGFCISVAEPSPPHAYRGESEYPIEMTWKTFTGEHDGLYLAVLKERCRKDGVDITDENLQAQLRLHIHRGISYLAGDRSLQSIGDLVSMAL